MSQGSTATGHSEAATTWSPANLYQWLLHRQRPYFLRGVALRESKRCNVQIAYFSTWQH